MRRFSGLISRSFWTPMRASFAVALGFAIALVVVFAVRWFDDGIQLVSTFRLRGYPTAIAWSPDGKVLASISEFGGSLSLWDVATGRRRDLGGLATTYIEPSLGFLADGRQLLAPARRSNGRDRSVRHSFTLWDVTTGAVVRDIEAPSPAEWFPKRYEVSRDGKFVVLLPETYNSRLIFNYYIYKTESWTIAKEIAVASDSSLWHFVLSRDEQRAILATTSRIIFLDLWTKHIDTKHIYDNTSISSIIKALAVSPNGEYLAIVGYRGSRRVSGNPLAEFVESDLLQIRSLADWKLISRADWGGIVNIASAVTWSADGAHVAVAVGTMVIVYSVQSDMKLAATARKITTSTDVTGLAFSPIGDSLALAEGGAIRIYKIGVRKG